MDASQAMFGADIASNNGTSTMVGWSHANDTGTKERLRSRQVGLATSMGLEWHAGFAVRLQISDGQAIEDLPSMFECQVEELVGRVSSEHAPSS
jgi:hypothetical protein